MNTQNLQAQPAAPAVRKRSVTISLADALVNEIESLKQEAQACGLTFSVTEICAVALVEAISRAREAVQQRSDIMGQRGVSYLGNRADG